MMAQPRFSPSAGAWGGRAAEAAGGDGRAPAGRAQGGWGAVGGGGDGPGGAGGASGEGPVAEDDDFDELDAAQRDVLSAAVAAAKLAAPFAAGAASTDGNPTSAAGATDISHRLDAALEALVPRFVMGTAGSGFDGRAAVSHSGYLRAPRRSQTQAEELQAVLTERETEIREQLEELEQMGGGIPEALQQSLSSGAAATRSAEAGAQVPSQGTGSAADASSLSGIRLPPQAVAAQACRAYASMLSAGLHDGARQGAKIVEAFEQRLDEAVNATPMEVLFAPGAVKTMCVSADGTQPHLVAPEAGLRRMVEHAIGQVLEPARECAWAAHAALLEGSRAIAQHSAAARRRPALYALLGEATEVAASKWRDDALEMAEAMVRMEQVYPTPHFFQERLRAQERAAEEERQRRLRAEHQARIEAARAAQERAHRLAEQQRNKKREREAKEAAEQAAAEAPATPTPPSAAPGTPSTGGRDDGLFDSSGDLETLGSLSANDSRNFLMGYLEKRSDGGAHWDKRWFVLNEAKCRLSYYKNPEDRTARGVIDMQRTRPQDMLAKGNTEPTAVFRVASKERGRPIVKDHEWLMLRAPSIEKKYEWLARLRAATQPPSEAIAYVPPSPSQPAVPPPEPSPPPPKETSTGASEDKGDSDTEREVAEAEAEAAEAVAAAQRARADSATDAEDAEVSKARTAADHERFLLEMGQAASEYCEEVFASLVATVPKAVVYAMLGRVEEDLTAELYTAVSGEFGRVDDEGRLEALVREDPALETWKQHANRSLEVMAKARGVLSSCMAEGHVRAIQRARVARRRARAH